MTESPRQATVRSLYGMKNTVKVLIAKHKYLLFYSMETRKCTSFETELEVHNRSETGSRRTSDSERRASSRSGRSCYFILYVIICFPTKTRLVFHHHVKLIVIPMQCQFSV